MAKREAISPAVRSFADRKARIFRRGVEASAAKFAGVPTLLLWGMKDFVFDRHFLAEWQRHFPHAESHTWPDCGHYLLEDAGEECIMRVREFLAKHPLAGG